MADSNGAGGENHRPHPAIVEAREVIALEEEQRLALAHSEIKQLEMAVMLAPDLETCEALLRGEHVPLSRLDPVYVRRYGLRPSSG